MKYTSLNQYLKVRFGTKIYKIALDGGFTCPNRDGTLGTRGCIFCSKGGSGDFAESRKLSIYDQIEQGKRKVAGKIKDGKYIAYFQAFTNTYASVDRLESLYMQAIEHEDIVALSIGTRPDCLSEEVIELLERLNKIKPIFVELGLQTIHEDTAKYIRRGYELSVYDDAVRRLHKAGLNVVTHLIIGLPNETKDDMLKSVEYVCNVTNGIKLQLLHILKDTDLEAQYNDGKIKT